MMLLPFDMLQVIIGSVFLTLTYLFVVYVLNG